MDCWRRRAISCLVNVVSVNASRSYAEYFIGNCRCESFLVTNNPLLSCCTSHFFCMSYCLVSPNIFLDWLWDSCSGVLIELMVDTYLEMSMSIMGLERADRCVYLVYDCVSWIPWVYMDGTVIAMRSVDSIGRSSASRKYPTSLFTSDECYPDMDLYQCLTNIRCSWSYLCRSPIPISLNLQKILLLRILTLDL